MGMYVGCKKVRYASNTQSSPWQQIPTRPVGLASFEEEKKKKKPVIQQRIPRCETFGLI